MKRRTLISIALTVILTAAMVCPAWAQETYTVRAGDTLYDIAAAYEMSVDELKSLNGLDSDLIRIGQELRVYGPAGGGPDVALRDTTLGVGPLRTYTVGEGETLYSIAADLGTKAYLLYALNGDVREPLEPGRQLVVPADPAGRRVYAVGEAAVFPDTTAGRTMAGGEAYDPSAFVASHRDLPMDAVLLLEHRSAGRATFVRVADRGPAEEGLLLEISPSAAEELGFEEGGLVHVWLVE